MCQAKHERVVEKAPSPPPNRPESTPAWNAWTQRQVVVPKREEARLLGARTDDTWVRAGIWAAIAVVAIVLALIVVRLVRRRRARKAFEREAAERERLLRQRELEHVAVAPPVEEAPRPRVPHPPRWRERGLGGRGF